MACRTFTRSWTFHCLAASLWFCVFAFGILNAKTQMRCACRPPAADHPPCWAPEAAPDGPGHPRCKHGGRDWGIPAAHKWGRPPEFVKKKIPFRKSMRPQRQKRCTTTAKNDVFQRTKKIMCIHTPQSLHLRAESVYVCGSPWGNTTKKTRSPNSSWIARNGLLNFISKVAIARCARESR